ncbi:hypothetical protein KAU11_01725, partial [Candidatus Babeliales bacterium]|nr:hypothetical protein [Candidatus Babeliales bacterium]
SAEKQGELSLKRDKIIDYVGDIALSRVEDAMFDQLKRIHGNLQIGLRGRKYTTGCNELQILIRAGKFKEKEVSDNGIQKVFKVIKEARTKVAINIKDKFIPGRKSAKGKYRNYHVAFANVLAAVQRNPRFMMRLQKVSPNGVKEIALWQRNLMKKGIMATMSGSSSSSGYASPMMQGMGGMPMGGMGMMGGGMYGGMGGMRY